MTHKVCPLWDPGNYAKKVLQEISLLVMHGASKPGWLPNVPNLDVVSLHLNCDLEGMREKEVRGSKPWTAVCTPVRTSQLKRDARLLSFLDSLLLSRWRSSMAHGSLMNLNILLDLKRPLGGLKIYKWKLEFSKSSIKCQ